VHCSRFSTFSGLALDKSLIWHGESFESPCIEVAARPDESRRHLATFGGERHAQVSQKLSCLMPYFDFESARLGEARPAKAIDTGLKINVCVYNLAKVPTDTLAQAEGEASKIFGWTGVQLTWLDYPLDDKEEIESGQTCGPPFGPADVRLRLLPHRLTELRGTHPRSLGLALPCAEADGGCFVNVFHQRAEELARDGDPGLPKVLGHAIAHEIGHLLLGSDAHSAIGLMRANWGPKDLQRADKGDLRFGAKEAELIRINVAGRMKQEYIRTTESASYR
jgi:hypothetical protein